MLFKIFPYNHRYHNQVLQLITHIQQVEFEMSITVLDQPDLNAIEIFYQKGNGNFWVAVIGDEVVGSIALIDIENSQVALRKMYVKKEYRKMHVAQQLLDVAIL